MKRTPIANQGEIRIDAIDELPDGLQSKPFIEKKGDEFIISHSESGHHHLLERADEVIERTNDVPEGMRMLYAILKNPSKLYQDAANPHAPVNLEAGVYEMRIKREFDPFTQQARKVAD